MKSDNSLKVQHKCDECEFESEGFFCNVRKSTLTLFESLKTTLTFPKGATIFMEGEDSTGIFLLCQGKVKLSTCSKDGKVIILHIAERGELLGLSSTVTDALHVATAEVIEPCQVNFVKNDDFVAFLRENADACLSAVKQLGRNYNTAYLQICSLGLSSSVSDKLASLFLGWCKAASTDTSGVHLKVSYTHEEIAEMIGTSRETVTRLLKDFKNQQLISRKGSEIIVHDTERLEKIIGTKTKSRL
jgi:CRP/FNR family cyclic AMP-dependent transcriptional regulator